MQNNNIPQVPTISRDQAIERIIQGYETTLKFNWHLKECLDEQVKLIDRLSTKIYFLEQRVYHNDEKVPSDEEFESFVTHMAFDEGSSEDTLLLDSSELKRKKID